MDRGSEGWVDLSFVVGADGTVRDPIVEDSTGVPELERTALAAILDARYSPATVDGKPVEQCASRMRYKFQITGIGLGGSKTFRKEYTKAYELLQANKLSDAAAIANQIAQEPGMNLYELGWVARLQGDVAMAQGKQFEALNFYNRAVRSPARLEAELLISLQREIFQLEAQLGLYAAASASYAVLKEQIPPQTTPELDVLAERIRSVIAGSDPIVSEGVIGYRSGCKEGRANWRHNLIRRSFSFAEPATGAEDFELRCDWRRYRGEVDTERTWEVDPDWGWCQLFVFGNPGATIKLVEHPAGANHPDDQRH